MPKRRSTATGTTAGAAAKKAKTTEGETSTIGNWVQSKTSDKELDSDKKNGLLRHDPAETLAAGPEIIPRPTPSFRECSLPSFFEDCHFLLILSSVAFFMSMGFNFMP
jgi:hypothetical protein